MESRVYDLIHVPDGNVAGMLLGRLGNQMFCTVAAMTYAKKTGRNFIGVIKEPGHSFNYPIVLTERVMRNVKFIDEKDASSSFHKVNRDHWLCNGFPNIDIKNVLLDGFFQDSRCIDREIAYDLFKPYDSIKKAIYDLYGDLSNVVCVHVRRGDYLFLTSNGFNVYSKEELDFIIKTFFQNDKIIFVSDDIRWCKENFIGDKYMFADKPYDCPAEIDLYIQTQCKANVISNSTFSWWGAFLNEKSEKVICHWPWFHSGKINKMETILPDNWIKVMKR